VNEICHPGDNIEDSPKQRNCKRPLRGKYVTFQKYNDDNALYVNEIYLYERECIKTL